MKHRKRALLCLGGFAAFVILAGCAAAPPATHEHGMVVQRTIEVPDTKSNLFFVAGEWIDMTLVGSGDEVEHWSEEEGVIAVRGTVSQPSRDRFDVVYEFDYTFVIQVEDNAVRTKIESYYGTGKMEGNVTIITEAGLLTKRSHQELEARFESLTDLLASFMSRGSVALELNRKGIGIFNSGDVEGAIREFTRAIELRPDHFGLYNNRGNARMSSGDDEGAVDDFTRALELNPDNPGALNNRGWIYVKQEKYPDAISDLDRAISLEQRPSFYDTRGWAYFFLDRLEEARRDAAPEELDYASELERWDYRDAESVTVGSERYWKAVLALSANDITALLVRLMLLMREGLLSRAEIVALFCLYDGNPGWERDKRLLNIVFEDISKTRKESNKYVEQGIRHWDAGKRQTALEQYDKALELYPKNPWALYEIGLDYRTFNTQELLADEVTDHFALIRRIDPHYRMAYQGELTPTLRKAGLALMDKVEPNYGRLWSFEEVPSSMRGLADGYLEMKEHELALYVYKFLLFHTCDGGFDAELVDRVSTCLRELGMDSVIPYLAELLGRLETVLDR